MGKSGKIHVFWIQSLKITQIPLRFGSSLKFEANPATLATPPPHTRISLMPTLPHT